jgi:DNA-binding transcriptional MerR regulator
LADRAYLSIGEVLSLLKDEFPEITISKIRFLESQGLLDPERTPSGYRKFYESDVERLRWILQQQRENFLPLKVIKGRLGVEAVQSPLSSAPHGTFEHEDEAEPDPVRSQGPSAPAPSQPVRRATLGGQQPDRRPVPAPPPPPPPAPSVVTGDDRSNYTLEELGMAVDLGVDQLAELEKYGLLAGRKVAGVTYYDDQALAVAQIAAGFLRFGVEARHLRMYKNSADREAGVFEQVVMPMMKQRNPEARRQALDTLSQLGQLGGQLRQAMLRDALRQYTAGL